MISKASLLLTVLFFCILPSSIVAQTTHFTEGSVKISISIPRGTDRFVIKADKAWANLAAGTERSVLDLLAAFRKYPRVINIKTLPKGFEGMTDPRVIIVEKNPDNIQVDDCDVFRLIREVVTAYVNPARQIKWDRRYAACLGLKSEEIHKSRAKHWINFRFRLAPPER